MSNDLLRDPVLTDEQRKAKDLGSRLYQAAAQGEETKVRQLVVAGAVVNWQNCFGRSPLSAAAYGAHEDVVKCLLDAGAKPDLKDKFGDKAVYWAKEGQKKGVLHEEYEAVIALLEGS